MGDEYLQDFGAESLKKTPLGIIGDRIQDNIKFFLK